MKVFFYAILRKMVTLFYKIIPDWLGMSFPPRPTASVIISKGGKILVVKISYKAGYSLPGGGVRIGESYEDAAKRETYEETGLKVIRLKYFHSYGSNDEYPATNIVFIAYAKGKLKNSIEGKPIWAEPRKIKDELAFSDGRLAITDWLKLHG